MARGRSGAGKGLGGLRANGSETHDNAHHAEKPSKCAVHRIDGRLSDFAAQRKPDAKEDGEDQDG